MTSILFTSSEHRMPPIYKMLRRNDQELNFFMWILFHIVSISSSGVRNYLKEALVNIIAVHAEVKQSPHTLWYISIVVCKSSHVSVRCLQCLRISYPGFCLKLSRQLQTRCVALCSVSPLSAKMVPYRYGLLITRPWLICQPPHFWGTYHLCFSYNIVHFKLVHQTLECFVFISHSYRHPQARLELCALRDAIVAYLNTKSKWVSFIHWCCGLGGNLHIVWAQWFMALNVSIINLNSRTSLTTIPIYGTLWVLERKWK